MPWNYGDILDAIAPALPPGAPAFIHGDRIITWAETTKRSNNLARALIKRGAKPRDKVAFYMRNRPEYVETLAASFKARLTHVNVNYRYLPDEVFYIFDDSDAQTVVYGAEFRDIISQIRPRLSKVQNFIEITDGTPPANFAHDYEALAAEGDGSPLKIGRSPEDEFFIYTGGTTGMPKGVLWRQADIFFGALGGQLIGSVTQRVFHSDADLWKSIALTAAILLPLAAFTISRGVRPYGREVVRLEQLEAQSA